MVLSPSSLFLLPSTLPDLHGPFNPLLVACVRPLQEHIPMIINNEPEHLCGKVVSCLEGDDHLDGERAGVVSSSHPNNFTFNS